MLLTLTQDVVYRFKEYFKDLLKPINVPSSVEAGLADSEVVVEVVKKLFGGKAIGVDEIRWMSFLRLWMLQRCHG